MKFPTRRIQWICLAISVYFFWLTTYLFLHDGFRLPKAIAGGIIGGIAFAFIGLSPARKSEKE
jgi:hypothetical protein